MNKKKLQTKDMTSGNILNVLITFMIPLFIGSLFQQLYNTADLIFVGNFTGKTGAAAVGASGLLVTCLVGLFTGISVGAGIVISRYIGRQDITKAKKTVETTLAFALVGGIIITVLGEFCVKFILEILQTPDSIMPQAVTYVRVYFLGIIPMVFYNMGAAILRACGNSKTPFYILAMGGILNVTVDFLFIGVLNLGVFGAAVATTISQSFSAVCILWYIFKRNIMIPIKLSEVRFQKGYIAQILHFGLPAGIQSMVLTFSNIIVQYYINGYGDSAIAAFTAFNKLENITYLPAVAFGQAITTFVSQNIGAGNFERVYKGVKITCISGVCIVTAIAGVVLLFPTQFIGCFVQDNEVVKLGIQIIGITFPFYWIYPLMEVFGGTVRAMGHSILAMFVTLTSLCGVRVLLLYILDSYSHTFKSIAMVYPITWGLAALCFGFIVCRKFLERKPSVVY